MPLPHDLHRHDDATAAEHGQAWARCDPAEKVVEAFGYSLSAPSAGTSLFQAVATRKLLCLTPSSLLVRLPTKMKSALNHGVPPQSEALLSLCQTVVKPHLKFRTNFARTLKLCGKNWRVVQLVHQSIGLV